MSKDYYKAGGIEVFDIIESFNLGFNLGNVCKYICRCGRKPGVSRIDDLKKAKAYIDREIENTIIDMKKDDFNEALKEKYSEQVEDSFKDDLLALQKWENL